MAEPTLLQQARSEIARMVHWGGDMRAQTFERVVELILQHLEQREAAMRGAAQVPGQARCKRCGQAADVIGLSCNGKMGHDFGPAQVPGEPRCAECGGDREYWPHSTPPTGEMHHPFRPSDPPSPALDLDELQRLCDAATPGPWALADDDDGDHLWVVRNKQTVCSFHAAADGAFIAAARDALPKLIAKVQELDAVAGHLVRAPKCPGCGKRWLGPRTASMRKCVDNLSGLGCQRTWDVSEEADHAR